jgi:hypothetical protein
MMLASTLRGVDGTGVVVGPLDLDKPVTYQKAPEPATSFMNRHDMSSLTRDARFIIGHTRAATLGSLTEEATHPFSEDSVCGVHNGTVHEIHTLFPELEGVNDSAIIYKALAAAEPDKAVDVLKELECGAYALVWYDSRLNALRFARNDDRPLWFHKADNMWWWASEPGTIASCIASVKKAPLSYTHIRPWQLRKHVLMTLPVDGSEATAEPYTPPVYAPPSYQQRHGNYCGRGWQSHHGGYGGYGAGQDDFWDKYYDNDFHTNQTGQYGDVSSSIGEGWVTLWQGDDLYNQANWFTRYRTNIRQAVTTLIKAALGRSTFEWKEHLLNIAMRSGTVTDNTSTPNVVFVGQATNEVTGMTYGALDIMDFGPMPIVGKASEEQMEIYKAGIDALPVDHSKLPLWQATLANVKVYAEGSTGLGAVDLFFMGWTDSSSVTLTEEAVGSPKTHPHLAESTWEEVVDWTPWLNK